jgi:hypothetical protein
VRRVRFAVLTCLAAAAFACLPACTHTFDVERRETPVHVWLTIPALAERGGQVDALIYVGPYKVVQGTVNFPQGVPTVDLPTLFVRPGPRPVSAVLDRGRASGRETVTIEGESWIQIVVRGSAVSIRASDEQPSGWGQ